MALAVSVLVTACGVASEDGASEDGTVVWQWDHPLTLPGTAYEELLTEELPRMVSEATDGRVRIEPVIGGTDLTETVDAVASGRFAGGTVVTSAYTGTHPTWAFGEVGFRFADYGEWEQALRGEAGEFARSVFEDESGLVQPGGAVTLGTPYLFTTEPVRRNEDWKGLRLRASGVGASDLLDAYGAVPVSMPFTDVYTSIDRGVIDGFLTAQNAALSISPWEVVGYLNTWPSGYGFVWPAINPKAWEALDDETRREVADVFTEMEEIGWEMSKEEERSVADTMSRNGIEIVAPDPADLADAKEQIGTKLEKLWLDRAGESGQELVKLLNVGE